MAKNKWGKPNEMLRMRRQYDMISKEPVARMQALDALMLTIMTDISG